MTIHFTTTVTHEITGLGEPIVLDHVAEFDLELAGRIGHSTDQQRIVSRAAYCADKGRMVLSKELSPLVAERLKEI